MNPKYYMRRYYDGVNVHVERFEKKQAWLKSLSKRKF